MLLYNLIKFFTISSYSDTFKVCNYIMFYCFVELIEHKANIAT